MPARPLATRRTALAVATGVSAVAIGGCTSESGGDPKDPASTSVPPVDADQALVDDVVARLSTALAAVTAARAQAPALARELRGLERMHRAHLEALAQDAVSDAAPGGAEDAAPDRRQVLAGESRVQRYLAAAAVRAESGTLARLLASMSASVAQHLAVLG